MSIPIERVFKRWGVRAPSVRSNKQFVGPLCTLNLTLTNNSADNLKDLRTADAWIADPGAKSAYSLTSGGQNPDCYCLVTEVLVVGSSNTWITAAADKKLAAAAQMQLVIGPAGAEDRYSLSGHIADAAFVSSGVSGTNLYTHLQGVAFALPDPQLLDLRSGSTFQIGFNDSAVVFGANCNMQVKIRGGLIPRNAVSMPAGSEGVADLCGNGGFSPRIVEAAAKNAAMMKRAIGSVLPYQSGR